MKSIFIKISFMALIGFLVVTACSSGSDEKENKASYYCPMECEGEKSYDKPGTCPICGVELVMNEVEVEKI